MNLGIFFGLLLLIAGMVLSYLSYQEWYIDWLKVRIPMGKSKLTKGERVSGVSLIVIGILQIIKTLV